MGRTWWPFRRRKDDERQEPDEGKKKSTRRIARRIAREALFAEEEPPPPLPPSPKAGSITVTTMGAITHVCFNRSAHLFKSTVLRKDPITRKVKRVEVDGNITRTTVFYTRDGRLIDDSTRPGSRPDEV